MELYAAKHVINLLHLNKCATNWIFKKTWQKLKKLFVKKNSLLKSEQLLCSQFNIFIFSAETFFRKRKKGKEKENPKIQLLETKQYSF